MRTVLSVEIEPGVYLVNTISTGRNPGRLLHEYVRGRRKAIELIDGPPIESIGVDSDHEGEDKLVVKRHDRITTPPRRVSLDEAKAMIDEYDYAYYCELLGLWVSLKTRGRLIYSPETGRIRYDD